MGNERPPPGWERPPRGRRNAWFALALAAHALLVLTMLGTRLPHERFVEPAVLAVTLWRPPPPGPGGLAALPARRPTRLRALPLPAADPSAPRAPALPPQAVAQAASAAVPTASAASAPLDLTFGREQARALLAQEQPTLAQRTTRAPRGSPYDRLAGEGDGMTLIEQAHGVTEVHLHGQCYRLVPSPRAQSDPFNHANERLTGPCIGGF